MKSYKYISISIVLLETDLVLINNPCVMNIPIKEKREKLVNLKNIHPRVVIDHSRNQISSRSDYFSYARETIAEMLINATDHLPNGYNFYIKEAYRSLQQQKISFESVLKYYSEKYSELNEEELYKETCKYVAPPICAPHPTGAAIDITFIDDNNNEFDLGTEFNSTPKETDNATFFNAVNISKEAIINREILKKALEIVGFVNYPPEWWHWSYGDNYWAFTKNEEYSQYKAIEEANIE